MPPGIVCFNNCPVIGGGNPPLVPSIGNLGLGLGLGALAYLNRDAIVPTYYISPSGALTIATVSANYLHDTIFAASQTSLSGDNQSVARVLPPCVPSGSCLPGKNLLTAPSGEKDPEAVQQGSGGVAGGGKRKEDPSRMGTAAPTGPQQDVQCEEPEPTK